MIIRSLPHKPYLVSKASGAKESAWAFHCHLPIIVTFAFKGEVQEWDRGRSSINIKSRFQVETTVRNYSSHFSFDVFKVYLSNIDSETAEIKINTVFEFWAWASHFIMI